MVPVLCLSPVQLSLPRSFSSLLSWHLSFIFYILSAGMAIQHEWRYWCILQYLTKQELGVACTSEERAVPLFSTGPLNISPRLTTNHLTLTDNPLFDFIESYVSATLKMANDSTGRVPGSATAELSLVVPRTPPTSMGPIKLASLHVLFQDDLWSCCNLGAWGVQRSRCLR
jgi:hypothetical protein